MSNSKSLAGAEACRSMLASIQRIATASPASPAVEGESGLDYSAADKALATALDRHSASAGFRAALVNHLLLTFDGAVLDMSRMAAADLLTHSGYRPEVQEPSEGDDGLTESVDFEDDGFRLESLLWLAEWIERARDLCDQLNTVAGYSEGLRDVLKLNDIAWGNAQWSGEASSGLNILNVTAIQLARSLAAQGMALEKQRKGAGHGQA